MAKIMGYEASKTNLPGVYALQKGGFLIRGVARNPKTGKLQEVRRILESTLAPSEAYVTLQSELTAIKIGGLESAQVKPRFADYATDLLERKVKRGDLASKKSEQRWRFTLINQLIPAFGEYFIDQITYQDISQWCGKIASPDYSPNTLNSWLSILRVIMSTATIEYDLPKDPSLKIKNFETSTHHTYTDEEPNSLTAEEVPRFLACMKEHHPQHYAMTALMFATGLRPSSLRPLRRNEDVLWNEGAILVRQSHTIGETVMTKTKTGKNQKLHLPEEIMALLQDHVLSLPVGPMSQSKLLFPSRTGSFRTASCLDKPFEDVAAKLELRKRITPRATRRTFQDLCRAAEVKDIVTRSISGHATEDMQRHYSTVNGDEQRAAVGQVFRLMNGGRV